MRILLAPMEGLLDHSLRHVLTGVGGVDRCVSEFIRVTDQLLPERVFTRIVPELLQGGRTDAGVPVRPQLLGSDPACLADNAAVLASLSPEGVDLNFGCPARTVNRHRGGAVLLDEPELVFRIVRAVRRAVPAPLPVSAKMRLGTHDASKLLANAQAIVDGGADELVVHARTKADGYRPPAHWELVAAVREAVPIPVVANGEVWTVDDARRCLATSGCDALMLGRGMVADPGLALALRQAWGHAASRSSAHPGSRPCRPDRPGTPADAGPSWPGTAAGPTGSDADAGPTWSAVRDLLRLYWQRIALHVAPAHRPGRLKQWLNLLRRRFEGAQDAYDAVRTLRDPRAVEAWLGLSTVAARRAGDAGGCRGDGGAAAQQPT